MSVACTNCGKNMTTDDLRRVNCVYCGTVLAHHQRAAQQVAVINQMMVDSNGNGIPDAFEGIAANASRNAYAQMGNQMGIGAANGVALGGVLGGMAGHGPGVRVMGPGVQVMGPGVHMSGPGMHIQVGGVPYGHHQHVNVHAVNQGVQAAAKGIVIAAVVIALLTLFGTGLLVFLLS